MAKPCPIHACEQTRIVQNTLDACRRRRVGAANTNQIGIARHDERPPCEWNPARERAPDALTYPCAAKTASLMAGEPVLLPMCPAWTAPAVQGGI